MTEKLDYSSAVALLGCSLMLAIIRAFSVKLEAARVMVSAPLIAFVTTHILYLNFYELDYGNPSESHYCQASLNHLHLSERVTSVKFYLDFY